MTFDCVGIGAGPFNLSLACLMEPVHDLNAVFLEKRKKFKWHHGMQLPGAKIQVSHIKDLVTLADPTNPYSFMNYLKERGQLYHFANAKFETVLRREFEDYLTWAFLKNPLVLPDHGVNSVSFDGDFQVITDRASFSSRAVSLGIGQVPALPDFLEPLDKKSMIHSSEYVDKMPIVSEKVVCVVGGGQSGAEVCLDQLTKSSDISPRKIIWITRRENFAPLDDSPFANELFTPYHSDAHFELDESNKRLALKQFKLASDGISASTLEEVYHSIYRHRFVERSNLETQLIPNATLTAVDRQSNGVINLSIRSNNQDKSFLVQCDVVVFCTGYRPAPLDFLGDLKDRFDMVGEEPRVRKDFSVVWDGPESHKIYLQNASRLQRGIADPNLSLNAWRSQVILDSIRGKPTATSCEEDPFLTPQQSFHHVPVASSTRSGCTRCETSALK